MPTQLEIAKARLGIPEVGKIIFPHWQPGTSCRCPDRQDQHPSFSVYRDGKRFHDFNTGEDGNVVAFLARVKGISEREACKLLIHLAGGGKGVQTPSPSCPKPSATADPGRGKPRLPVFDEGTPEEHRRLARLRNLCEEAIALAVERGTLRFFNSREGRAWCLTDNDRWVAQARRLDGERWQRILSQPKAWTLPGSRACWPCGVKDGVRCQRLIVTEGGPDMLAGFHFLLLSEIADVVGVICLLGAGCSFPKETLRFFENLPIRIFGHNDVAGLAAVKRWAKQLTDAGACVSAFSFQGLVTSTGQPVKDLCDLASIGEESFETYREVIENAMFF